MSHLLLRSLTALACLGVFSLPQSSAAAKPDQSDQPNLSGTWTLDLKASDSLEPLMNQIGASLPEREYATSTELKATFSPAMRVGQLLNSADFPLDKGASRSECNFP